MQLIKRQRQQCCVVLLTDVRKDVSNNFTWELRSDNIHKKLLRLRKCMGDIPAFEVNHEPDNMESPTEFNRSDI